jgi:hypothetical protein
VPNLIFVQIRKYIAQNILFKLTEDNQVGDTGIWMYGGDQKDDEKALKSASHELKGLMGYYSCSIEGLHVPLVIFFFALASTSLESVKYLENSQTILQIVKIFQHGTSNIDRSFSIPFPRDNVINTENIRNF